MDILTSVISMLYVSMASRTHLKCFILGIVSTCILHVQSVYYLEDICRFTDFSEKFFSGPKEFFNYSSVQYFEASSTRSYSRGITCNLGIRLNTSSYDFILSVKRIQFRVGYQDYLKIIHHNNQETMMIASKYERDAEMQFYGKQFLLQYVTEAGGPEPLYYIGFSLSLTIAENDTFCGKLRGFRCANGYCIDRYMTCDDINNCGDFSDEDRCVRLQDGSNSSPGTVVLISMFLMAIIGIVGGCIISMCLTTFLAEIMKRHRAGRQPLRTSSIDSSVSSSSPTNLLEIRS